MFVDLFNWVWDGPIWHLLVVCGLIGFPVGIVGARLSDNSEIGSRRYELGVLLEDIGAPLAAAVVLPLALGMVVGGAWVLYVAVSWVVGLF